MLLGEVSFASKKLTEIKVITQQNNNLAISAAAAGIVLLTESWKVWMAANTLPPKNRPRPKMPQLNHSCK